MADFDETHDEGLTTEGGSAPEPEAAGTPEREASAGEAEPDAGAIDSPSSALLAGPEGDEPEGRAAAQTLDELKAIIEALIFASPEPLTPKALFKLLASEPSEDVQAALDLLLRDYERPGGLQIVQVASGYQIVTRPELHDWVRRLFHERTTQKLSVQALETLSVIAYKQPITAAETAEIRGVNTSGVLNTLMERQLIKISGRKQVVGRPFLYSTTREFLIRFGLKDLTDLPKIEDMSEVLGFEPPAGLVDVAVGESISDAIDGARADRTDAAGAPESPEDEPRDVADSEEDEDEFGDEDSDFESDDPDAEPEDEDFEDEES